MRERVCKNCGGREYKVVGENMVQCKFCGTLYVDEHSSKEEEVLIIGANEILRTQNFEQAEDEFEKILQMFPLSYNGHLGRALARKRIIIYKKGQSKRARFFDGVVSIKDDENFKKAMEIAPPEENFKAIAEMIEKTKNQYDQTFSKQEYDCVICGDAGNENMQNFAQILQKDGKNVYILPQRDNEAQTYRALETAKALVLFVSEKGTADFKHVCDRYLFFIQKKMKTRSSVIAVGNQQSHLPKELSFCQKIELEKENWMHDLTVLVKKEMEKSVNETVKIETVKVEKVEPNKKEYVDIESVTPQEVGNYHVENVNVNDETKVRWIFLSLKNGDFQTASQLVKEALAQEPYNSQLLLAQLMADKQIKTKEDFFSTIANFNDKEKIDDILRYANKEFAEDFVDSWEKLIVSINDIELYQKYLTYLAGFKTPYRETFVKAAEDKAIETLDEDLIGLVLQCFAKSDVDKFIQFYFHLAQKSDDKKYYQKILEIDEGHVQSNIALFLLNFKSTEDILSYRDSKAVEDILKYFDENARLQLVTSVVNMIVNVAFYDLERAQTQLDFYLAYISDDEQLAKIAADIAEQMKQMRFFKVAEKYISIAISKAKEKVELYWNLILIKAHCRSDNELMKSSVKVSQMPEWETLLALGDTSQEEHYASIVSKGNLYKGERTEFLPDLPDKKQLTEKLKEFLLRNEQILLDAEKTGSSIGGVNYYKQQLQPFEKYIRDIDEVEKQENYVDIVNKINERLDALQLNLDSSLSSLKIDGVSNNMTKISDSSSHAEEKIEKIVQNEKKKQFLKRFLCVFLEFFPMLFSTLLFCVMIFAPKQVFVYFNQNFLIWSLFFCIAVAILNGAVFMIKRKKLAIKSRIVYLCLFMIGVCNLILFATGFYFAPKTLEIGDSKELQVLLHNAYYSNFRLDKDIDLKGKAFESKNFYGSFDGNGHVISNVAYKNGGLFNVNNGKVKNLTLQLANKTYRTTVFGGIAKENRGTITNCHVTGVLTFVEKNDAVLGGLVADNNGGKIENCTCNLQIVVEQSKGNLYIGGISGKTEGEKASVLKNGANVNMNITLDNVKNLFAGGVCGAATAGKFSENASDVDLSVFGTTQDASIGGLIGMARVEVRDSRAVGEMQAELETGIAGGLIGKFVNMNSVNGVEHSYSSISYVGGMEYGTLVGKLSGRVNNCFSTESGSFGQSEMMYGGFTKSCKANLRMYDEDLDFDNKVWNVDVWLPTLLWET